MRSGAKRVARIKSGSKEMRTVNDSLADRASVKKINGGSFFKAVPPKNGIVGGHTVLSGNYLRAPSAKSDWIFWSLARLIDLTKSQKKKNLSMCQLVVEIIALARSQVQNRG